MHCLMVGWVLKLGPVVDDLYDYMIVAAETKNETFARTRNISRFDEYYEGEVREWLKERTPRYVERSTLRDVSTMYLKGSIVILNHVSRLP